MLKLRIKKFATALLAVSMFGSTAFWVNNPSTLVQAKTVKKSKKKKTKQSRLNLKRNKEPDIRYLARRSPVLDLSRKDYKKTMMWFRKNEKVTVYGYLKFHGKKYYQVGPLQFIETKYFKKLPYKITMQVVGHVRNITVINPDGNKESIEQDADFNRIVHQNWKTKKKTYGKWNVVYYKAYKVPQIDGYTSSVKTVPRKRAYPWSKDEDIVVTYKENK